MTPFNRLSPFSVRLHSWELEKKKNKLKKLDDTSQNERSKYSITQDKAQQDLKRIEHRHKIIDETYPLIAKYTKRLQNKCTEFEDRAIALKLQNESKLQEKLYLQKEFICLSKMENRTQHRLKEFEVFKKYLENVCRGSENKFSSTTDLLDGFAFMAKVREIMFHRIQESSAKRKEKQEFINKYVEDSEMEMLKVSSIIQEMKRRKEKLDSEVIKLEITLARIQENTSQETLKTGNLQMAICNLYMEVCRILKCPVKVEANNTIGHLIFLETAMEDLKRLSKRAQETSLLPGFSAAATIDKS